MSDALKPCPFCGGEADFDSVWLFCVKCGVGYEGDDKPKLRKAWNRRAPDPALLARLEAVENVVRNRVGEAWADELAAIRKELS